MLLANGRSDIVETVSRTVSRQKKSIKISQSDIIQDLSDISTFPGCILFFEKNSVICELLCAYRLLCEKKGAKLE